MLFSRFFLVTALVATLPMQPALPTSDSSATHPTDISKQPPHGLSWFRQQVDDLFDQLKTHARDCHESCSRRLSNAQQNAQNRLTEIYNGLCPAYRAWVDQAVAIITTKKAVTAEVALVIALIALYSVNRYQRAVQTDAAVVAKASELTAVITEAIDLTPKTALVS